MSGPLIDDAGEKMNGSFFLVEAESRADVESFNRQDPFFNLGLWNDIHIPVFINVWAAEQTVDFMMKRLSAGDFYILCPDNAVPRSLDERRILWAAGDVVENRPP